MAKRKATAAANTKTPATSSSITNVTPPAEVISAAPSEALETKSPKLEPIKAEAIDTAPLAIAAAESTAAPAVAQASRTNWQRHVPLAAALAVAAVLGAGAGAATVALTLPAPAADTNAEDVRALREAITRLNSEFTALKSGVDTSNRNITTQFSRLAERLDRAEKAQTEPAARLAKIMESLDRLERRPASTSVAAAPEATGSVSTVEKQQGKPPSVEGWKLLDFYAGRAVLENRAGGLFEVGPGSNLPGVGRIETIKRQDGRVIVVTPKGVISAALEPRRTPYMPYR